MRNYASDARGSGPPECVLSAPDEIIPAQAAKMLTGSTWNIAASIIDKARVEAAATNGAASSSPLR